MCRRLYDAGLIAGQDGNVSVRLGKDVALVTPSGASKADVAEDDLVLLHLDGSVIGAGAASSEVRIAPPPGNHFAPPNLVSQLRNLVKSA